MADGIVDEGGDRLANPLRVGPHGEAARRVDRNLCGRDGRERQCHAFQQWPDLQPIEPEGQRARLGKRDGAQVVDRPAERTGLVPDRGQVAVLVPVDAVKDRARGRLDDRERRAELVDHVLEEPPPGRLRPRQLGGHRVEGAAQRAQLVRPRCEAGSPIELSPGDSRSRMLETAERLRDAGGEQRAEERRPGRRGDGHDDEGHDRVLLDLLRVKSGHRAGAPAGPGPLLLGRQDREPVPDDRRRGQRHRPGSEERDEGEGGRESRPQAHGRAAR